MLTILELYDYYAWISFATGLLGALVVLKLYSKHTNSAMKMPWIMLIMAFPVMGLCMYLLFELLGDPGVSKRLKAVRSRMLDKLPQADGVFEKLEQKDPMAAGQFRYLKNTVGAPVYENTKVEYYAEAVDAFDAMNSDRCYRNRLPKNRILQK